MSLLKNLLKIVIGSREPEKTCPDTSGQLAFEPIRGAFFDPSPDSVCDTGTGIQALGPARIEVGRLGPRRFRLLRRVGYRDRQTGDTWVVPRDLDGWTLNFSSAPVLVNWIIPVLGSHFNAFVLHDALVEDEVFDPQATGTPGNDYVGPKVSREEADRIARDAMGEQGTGFVRRWIAWVGMMIGTIFSKEGIGVPAGRVRFIATFVIYVAVLLCAGTYSTGEVFGWWQWLPWMAGEDWPMRLLFGGLGAILAPVVLCGFWGSRWLFGLIAGLLLAVLLPALAVTAALTLLYIQAERVFKWLNFTKPNVCTLEPLALGERDRK